ncbi:DUF2442 domain-containing protein [Desulfosporosinus sp. PR]|uniref:DUF2442 domain-containing protein n=1 Tax=Candidatus Desulfosporosinus nitrosoreducens TaxID=3401928 RepID=UPI0027E64B1D|nr:DUF2442 domain-containing protein [Desulfosporosinus sp. PR]MDQ7093936.1 DUF2442 domain-containing protein [Desulfosporosinus sp. PR]
MFPPKVKAVVPTDDFCLIVTFNNGIIKQYDVFKRLHEPRFSLLRNKSVFKDVKIESGGYGLYWDSKADISEHELWNESVEIN